MPKSQADPFDATCPSQDILALIGSKWSMLLLCALEDGPARTGALLLRAGGISQKMLTQTLRGLTRHGIVNRKDYGELPPRVEYSLTPLGRSLSALVAEIENWVTANYPRMTDNVRRYDAA
jgi:DNA-binding HxlR family transcriptional regulator